MFSKTRIRSTWARVHLQPGNDLHEYDRSVKSVLAQLGFELDSTNSKTP